jgi:hypothetical protein
MHLDTNSAFDMGPRKSTDNFDQIGRLQELPDANWLLANSADNHFRDFV